MENPNCTHYVLTSSSPVYTQSLLQGPPPLFTPYLLNARQLGVYTSQAPPHLLELTMPTSALSTMVQPTPAPVPAPVPSAFGTQQAVGYAAPQHNVAVTPATGLGVNVAPVTLLLEQVTQPIVVTAAQITPSAAAIATCNAIASSSVFPAITKIMPLRLYKVRLSPP